MVEETNPSEAAENTPHKHSGADPSESPYYNRIFWASYKGQSRGLWGGLLLGAGLGTLAGLAIGVGATALTAVTAGAVLPIAGACALGGMLYAKQIFTLSGAVAGAVAAGMEISEEREKERGQAKTLTTGVDKNVLSDIETMVAEAKPSDLGKMATGEKQYKGNEKFSWFGRKHHGEGERPLFFAGVGLAGAAIGAAAGGLISLVGGELIKSAGLLTGLGVEGAAVAAVVTAGCALIGASYGINRHNYRDVFDVTNKLYDGELLGKTKEKSVAVEKTPEVGQASPQHAAVSNAGWRRLDGPETLVSSAQLQEQGRVQTASEHDIIH